ncbi:MAG: vanadium-dependent haloperoxidase [Blastocatellia bacterium]
MKKNRKDRETGFLKMEGESAPSRREFLGRMGAWTAAGMAVSAGDGSAAAAEELNSGELSGAARAEKAYQTRVQAALFQKIAPKADHRNNGDENLYPNRIANYSKGLPHNQLGEVDRTAYESLMQAVKSGNPDDFDRILVGGSLQLKNPQAGIAFEMVGLDPVGITQPPAPTFSSAETAAEMGENYWMALARDIKFQDYDTHPLISAAVQDLNRFTDFRGAKHSRITIRRIPVNVQAAEGEAPVEAADINSLQASLSYRTRAKAGFVTTGNLFRGLTPGDVTGPYISQFLWKDAPFGAQTINQRMRTVNPGTDYLTSYNDWLDAQTGRTRGGYVNDPTPRYIRNGRDLGEWVHIDVLYQAYFNAMLILLGMNAPVDPNNPYNTSRNQCGFGTFGPPHIAALLPSVATAALRTVWHQKWFVHRRLRPEAFAGRIHNHQSRAANYPLHPEILASAALPEVHQRAGTWLLPTAYPEGCPAHPAYGAGHATVAGACVTILKAWFDEAYIIPDPVVPTADGLALTPYRGPESLTVGGELDKLASNVALGRNFAGVHWRSDATESLKLGEAIAIGILQDYKGCYNERFEGFSLTRFDGTRVILG